MPGWVAPTVALSLVIIAIVAAAALVVLVTALRRAEAETQSLAQQVGEIRRELAPTLEALKHFVATSQEVSDRVRGEVDAVLRTSRRVRKNVKRGVRRVRGHLEELDALYEVIHDEVQDTALDVAATLRGVRKGAGAIGKLRRLLVKGRR
jgi:Flp pilus assembly protein TadB